MSLPPLVKGGQGRTGADVRRAASGMVWTWTVILALLVACCGASR
jgi:hypothetical protein